MHPLLHLLQGKHALLQELLVQLAPPFLRHIRKRNSSMIHIYSSWLAYSLLISLNQGQLFEHSLMLLRFSVFQSSLSPHLPPLFKGFHTHMPVSCSNSKNIALKSNHILSSHPSTPDSFHRNVGKICEASNNSQSWWSMECPRRVQWCFPLQCKVRQNFEFHNRDSLHQSI